MIFLASLVKSAVPAFIFCIAEPNRLTPFARLLNDEPFTVASDVDSLVS